MADTPFKLNSGNSPLFSHMGSSSPLRGCAEDPSGKGCGDFRVGKQRGKKIKQAVRRTTGKIKDLFKRKKRRKKDKKKNTSSETSYQDPRTLATADLTLTESQRRKKIDEEVKRKGG